MERVDVDIAIISRGGKVLICQRKAENTFGGCWEFPGGKREPGETAEQCLRRELDEELAVRARPIEALDVIEHDYPAARVRLHPYLCEHTAGEPQLLACQQAIWVDPPREIVDLHRGEIPSGAGSYAQYFSTLVFVNGETRPLGYCALNGLVRLSQKESLSLQVLCEAAPTFMRTSAEFLGYCGLSTLRTFTQETLAILPQLQTKQQFTALIGSLALYANVLNTWNLQYFPWNHGSEYPARSSASGRRPAHPAL